MNVTSQHTFGEPLKVIGPISLPWNRPLPLKSLNSTVRKITSEPVSESGLKVWMKNGRRVDESPKNVAASGKLPVSMPIASNPAEAFVAVLAMVHDPTI